MDDVAAMPDMVIAQLAAAMFPPLTDAEYAGEFARLELAARTAYPLLGAGALAGAALVWATYRAVVGGEPSRNLPALEIEVVEAALAAGAFARLNPAGVAVDYGARVCGAALAAVRRAVEILEPGTLGPLGDVYDLANRMMVTLLCQGTWAQK